MATVAMVAGSALKAVSAVQQGRAASSAANFRAQQLEQNAKAERATSQRQALESRRKIDLAASRATALAAAGGAAGPSIQNILGGLGAEAEYAFGSELSAGENRAKGLETSAASARVEGKAAKRSGYMSALTTIAQTGSSLYNKYAPDDIR